ncbi:MAG: nucleotidyl transferase AbiEii/AbiGii toxin family protein [Candidatus Micrarchaeota archaeon]
MIDRETLVSFAKLNGMRPWQQERHYVQSVALVALSDYPLVFKGGTYLWFFHGLNRFSEDLDFTASGALPADLPEKISRALELFGVENSLKKITDDERSLSFRLSAKGPLNSSAIDLCHVYAEISRREDVARAALSLSFNFDAYQLPTKIVAGMSLDEVAAEKVRAIYSRDKARDLYDLFFLVGKKNAVFDLQLANDKLGFYGLGFSASEFAEKVAEKKAVWKKELEPLVFGELPEFARVQEQVLAWANKAL